MNDNDIIKALECCTDGFCYIGNCPLGDISDGDRCIAVLCKSALDLINRQKAEIEKLTINMNAFGLGMKREKERADTARADAIKEFAERLKPLLFNYYDSDIDDLVKEMTEENSNDKT